MTRGARKRPGRPRRPGPRFPRIRHALSAVLLVGQESFRTFRQHHALETSATLSFYALMAAIPVLLLTVFLLSRALLTSQAALAAVEDLSFRMAPEFGHALLKEVRTLAEQRVWTGVSLVAVFWLIVPLSATFRAAFDRAFFRTEGRPFWRAKLRDLAGALALLAMFLLIALGRAIEDILRSRMALPAGTALWHSAGWFLLTALGLLVIYLVFQPARPRAGHLAAGALVSTVLLFLLRPAFAAFLRFNPDYGFAFGSLKAVFVLVMWGYLSFAVILFGAEVIATIRRRHTVLLRGLLDPSSPENPSSTLVRRFLRRFEPGRIVFREGEKGSLMYAVRQGEVLLSRGGRVFLTLRTGDYFGEMTMLLDAPRTATAAAGGAGAELVEIGRDQFDQIVRENPQVVASMLREMAARLRDTDDAHLAGPASKTGGRPEEDARRAAGTGRSPAGSPAGSAPESPPEGSPRKEREQP